MTFKEPEEADVCLEALNGRWFGGRQLSATVWDGKTKYDIKESEQETEARLKKWEKFLETGEGEPGAGTSDQKTGDGGEKKGKESDGSKQEDSNKEADAKDETQEKKSMEVGISV